MPLNRTWGKERNYLLLASFVIFLFDLFMTGLRGIKVDAFSLKSSYSRVDAHSSVPRADDRMV